MISPDDGGGGGGGGRPSSDAAVAPPARPPRPPQGGADITPRPAGEAGDGGAAAGSRAEPGGSAGRVPVAADPDASDVAPAAPPSPAGEELEARHQRRPPRPPPPSPAEPGAAATGWREGVGASPQRLSREHLRRLDERHADDGGAATAPCGTPAPHVDETHEVVSDISSDSGLAPDCCDARRPSSGSGYNGGPFGAVPPQPAGFALRVASRTKSFTNYSINNSEHGGSIHGSTISSRRENVDRLLMGGGGSTAGGSGHGSYSGHDGRAFAAGHGPQQMAYGGAGPAAAGPMGHDMAPAAAYNYDRAYYRSNDWLRFVPRRSFVDTNSSGGNLSNPTTETGSNPGVPVEQYLGPGGGSVGGGVLPHRPPSGSPHDPHGQHRHAHRLHAGLGPHLPRGYNADNPDHYYRGFDNTRIRLMNSRTPVSRVRPSMDDAASSPELAGAYAHFNGVDFGRGAAEGGSERGRYPAMIHGPIDEEEGGAAQGAGPHRVEGMFDYGVGPRPAEDAGAFPGAPPHGGPDGVHAARVQDGAAGNLDELNDAGAGDLDNLGNLNDAGPAPAETAADVDQVEAARREMPSPGDASGGAAADPDADRAAPDGDDFDETGQQGAFETSVRGVVTTSPPPRECSPAVASLPTLASRDTSLTASANNCGYSRQSASTAAKTPGSRQHSDSTRVRSGGHAVGDGSGSAHHLPAGTKARSPPPSPSAAAAAPSEMMQFSSSLRVGGIVRPVDHSLRSRADGGGGGNAAPGVPRQRTSGAGRRSSSSPPPAPPHVLEEMQMHEASWDSKYVTYACRVDQRQDDRSVEIALFSMARPHMRAFHYAWLSFFFAFLAWFAITPLLAEVQSSLGLTKEQIWTSSICSVAGAVVTRCMSGLFCDIYGARWMSAVVLFICGVPTVLTGAVNTSAGLSVLRLVTGIGGSAFVTCQYWTTTMFTKEVAGTANALAAGWGNLGGGVSQIFVGSMLFPLFKWIFTVSGADGDPADLSWRVCCVIPGLACTVFTFFVIRSSDDSPKGNYNKRKQLGLMQKPSAGKHITAALRDHNTWLLLIQYGCCFGVELATTNAAALYFQGEFELGTEAAAALASTFGFMNIFARGLGGFLSDISNAYRGMRGRLCWQLVCFFLEGVFVMVFARARTLAGAISALMTFSIFVQGAEGSTFGIVPYLNPAVTGTVAGVIGAGGNVGAVIFSIFFRQMEYRQAFFLMGACTSAISFMSLGIWIKGYEGLLFQRRIPPGPDEEGRGTADDGAGRSGAAQDAGPGGRQRKRPSEAPSHDKYPSSLEETCETKPPLSYVSTHVTTRTFASPDQAVPNQVIAEGPR